MIPSRTPPLSSRPELRVATIPTVNANQDVVMRGLAVSKPIPLDPDVITLGEMRDLETARVAIEASLTGHWVLSTLHTKSAPEERDPPGRASAAVT